MSYKSRGNWNIGSNISQERWDSIFGKKCKCEEGSWEDKKNKGYCCLCSKRIKK